MVISSKMAVNYRGICFITLAPGHIIPTQDRNSKIVYIC